MTSQPYFGHCGIPFNKLRGCPEQIAAAPVLRLRKLHFFLLDSVVKDVIFIFVPELAADELKPL